MAKNEISDDTVKSIVKELESIAFGSLTIIVQNGKIVQIEKNEKKRL